MPHKGKSRNYKSRPGHRKGASNMAKAMNKAGVKGRSRSRTGSTQAALSKMRRKK